MNTAANSDQAIIEEGTNVLLEHLPLSKVARLFAAWGVGSGDYVQLREKLFANETVASLATKAREHS
jgi:hypothetical protein